MTQLTKNNHNLQRAAQIVDLTSQLPPLITQNPRFQQLISLAVRNHRWMEHLEEVLPRLKVHMRQHPDLYLFNTAPVGTFAQVPDNHVPLGELPTGETLSIPIGFGGTSSHILVAGASGYGKSTFLLRTLQHMTRKAIIVAFDRKGDLTRLAHDDPSGQTVVLEERDLKIAMFERI